MKILFNCLAMLCLFSNVSFAQLASTDYSIPTENRPTYKSIEKANPESLELAAMIAQKHTESATKQLKSYLANSLQYSDMLIENGIEGEVLVTVNIATDGTLMGFTILESPHAELTKMVEQVLENLKAVNFKNHWYRGLNQVEIPLNFSLR